MLEMKLCKKKIMRILKIKLEIKMLKMKTLKNFAKID